MFLTGLKEGKGKKRMKEKVEQRGKEGVGEMEDEWEAYRGKMKKEAKMENGKE